MTTLVTQTSAVDWWSLNKGIINIKNPISGYF